MIQGSGFRVLLAEGTSQKEIKSGFLLRSSQTQYLSFLLESSMSIEESIVVLTQIEGLPWYRGNCFLV